MRPLGFATLFCGSVAFLPGCGSAHAVRLITAQVECDKLPAGPPRTDCYIGLGMIYRQQFEIAAGVARRQRDIARHRRVTGDRIIKQRHP